MSGRLEQRWKGDRFRMLDPASLPEKPVFPKPPLVPRCWAPCSGLFVGLAAALVAEYLDPTVKDSEVLQAVQGYPVLASHPASPGPRPLVPTAAALAVRGRGRGRRGTSRGPRASRGADACPARPPSATRASSPRGRSCPIIESLEDHNSVVGEELRLFAANLLDTCRRLKVSCLGLTSALPGEGKSTLSVGPGQRARPGAGPADPARSRPTCGGPSLTKTLGLPPAHGLSEWLNGTLDYVPRARGRAGRLLPGDGRARPGCERPELLGSPRMDAVLKAGRRLFDLVLLDAVPVLPVADTVLMQDLVDGFQLVVRSRRTPRDAIHDTLAKLRSDRVIGVVFNGHQEYEASYKDYGYRRYGMDYGASPTPAEAARPRRRRARPIAPTFRGRAPGSVRPGWLP